MNEYEARRQEKIKRNQALFAELDIKPLIPQKTPRHPQSNGSTRQPPAKKRKIVGDLPTAPSRSSARLASAPRKPDYTDDGEVRSVVALPRSAPRRRGGKSNEKRTLVDRSLGSVREQSPESLVPAKNVDEIREGWTKWEVSAESPTRDVYKVFHFADYPDFTPNKSPEEMLREGAFGGSYYRPLRSRKLGIVVQDDWKELPPAWIEGLNVDTYLANPAYNPEINKFKVSCGQSIEEWEAAGWISHEHDVRGWFQWYTRFFRGRRCDDDERQVGRWKKCVGETGRWRRTLLKKYGLLGVREVFDDGEGEEGAAEVSPVVHQTCHHWAFEVRQEHLDEFWAGR